MMIAGNGFFKPNIPIWWGSYISLTIIERCCIHDIYMGINLGGAIGPFICGLVGNTGNPADFKWAFFGCRHRNGDQRNHSGCISPEICYDPDNHILGMIPKTVPKVLCPHGYGSWLAAISVIAIALIYIDAKVFSYLFYLLIACLLLYL